MPEVENSWIVYSTTSPAVFFIQTLTDDSEGTSGLKSPRVTRGLMIRSKDPQNSAYSCLCGYYRERNKPKISKEKMHVT